MKQWSTEAGTHICVCVHVSGRVHLCEASFCLPKALLSSCRLTFFGTLLQSWSSRSSEAPYSVMDLCPYAFSEMLAPSPVFLEHWRPNYSWTWHLRRIIPPAPHCSFTSSLRCFLLYAPVILIFVAAVNTMGYSFSAYFSFLPWSIRYSSLGSMS